MATLDIKLKKANKVYREGVGYTRMPFSVSLVYKVLKRYRSWCILNRLVFPQEIYREVDKHHLIIWAWLRVVPVHISKENTCIEAPGSLYNITRLSGIKIGSISIKSQFLLFIFTFMYIKISWTFRRLSFTRFCS